MHPILNLSPQPAAKQNQTDPDTSRTKVDEATPQTDAGMISFDAVFRAAAQAPTQLDTPPEMITPPQADTDLNTDDSSAGKEADLRQGRTSEPEQPVIDAPRAKPVPKADGPIVSVGPQQAAAHETAALLVPPRKLPTQHPIHTGKNPDISRMPQPSAMSPHPLATQAHPLPQMLPFVPPTAAMQAVASDVARPVPAPLASPSTAIQPVHTSLPTEAQSSGMVSGEKGSEPAFRNAGVQPAVSSLALSPPPRTISAFQQQAGTTDTHEPAQARHQAEQRPSPLSALAGQPTAASRSETVFFAAPAPAPASAPSARPKERSSAPAPLNPMPDLRLAPKAPMQAAATFSGIPPLVTPSPQPETMPHAPLLLGEVDPVTGQRVDVAGPHAAQGAAPLTRTDMPQHLSRQVVEALQHMPNRPVEISLSPEELGRVRLGVSSSEGGIIVSILAERPDTMDLLRRHIASLETAFQNIGYSNIAFSFAGGDPDRTDQHGTAGSDPSQAAISDDGLPDARPHQIDLTLAAATGLDIRL